MISMKLNWSSRSPFARKVMVTAHEAGVAERIMCVPTLVNAETFNADYARINPTGLLPALSLDDGSVLFDSDVICEYLNETFAESRLLPPHGPPRYETLRRQSLGNAVMDRAVRWLGENFRPPALKSTDVTGACHQWIETTLDALECDVAVSNTVESRFDLGDIAVATALAYLDFRFAGIDWRRSRPNLEAQFAGHAARHSLQATAFAAS